MPANNLTQADKKRIEQEEREANYFAMCLLIPEAMLRADLAEMFPGGVDVVNNDIERLADRYKVSRELMTLRLADLGMAF